MSQLVLDLIKNITTVSKADGAEFSASIKDSFEACSTFESYLTGIAEKQYVHCISQCLQNLAENATSPEMRPFLWNPIVASLIKCVSALAEREPYGTHRTFQTPRKPSSSIRKTAEKTQPPKGKKPVSSATPKPKNQSASDIPDAMAKVSLGPAKGVETPSSSITTKVDPQVRLKVYSEVNTARSGAHSPFIKQLKGGNHGEPVTCKVPGCATCEKFFSLVPLTRCGDIRCHRAGQCTPSGWYPHVLPHIWATIKKAHTHPSIDVRFMGLPETQLPSLRPPVVSEPLPKKRSWAQAAINDSTDSEDDVAPKIMSPAWTGNIEEVNPSDIKSPVWTAESWSAQVEAEELSFDVGC